MPFGFLEVSISEGRHSCLPTNKNLRDRAVSLQGQPHTMPAGDTAAPSCESKLSAEAKPVAQFRFRILVVDDEPSICEAAGQILESEGYETGWMA
jgi:hypothetical protein